LAALKSLRGAFDVMVIDAGVGLSRLARRLWLRAQLVLLVTSADDAAVMDAYAALKRHVVGAPGAMCANIRLLVNQAENDRVAEDAQRRLENSCQRFLKQNVAAAPSLPLWDGYDDALRQPRDIEAGTRRHPRVWEAPNSEFGHAVLWLGRAVEDALQASGSDLAELSRK
jgi:MinD-like ATPase involved in chromosome partitioning or flagellar assembly